MGGQAHPAVGSTASPRKSAPASLPRQVSSVLQGQLGAMPNANSAFAPPMQARAMDVYIAASAQNPLSGAMPGSYVGPAANANTATQNQAVAIQRARSPLSAHRGLSPVVVSRQHAVQRQYSPIRTQQLP